MLSWNAPLDRFLNYSGDLKGICFESWAILLLKGAPLLAECPSQSPSLQKKQQGAESFTSTELEKQHTTEKTSNLWEVLMIRSCRFPWKHFFSSKVGHVCPQFPQINQRTVVAFVSLLFTFEAPKSWYYQNPSAKFYVTSLPSGPFKRETTKGSISTDSLHTPK